MNHSSRTSRRRGPVGHGRGPAEKARDFKGTWKKLLHYCRRYLAVMMVALLCASVGTVLTLIGPDKLSELTDAVTQGVRPDTDELTAIWQAMEENYQANFRLITEEIDKALNAPEAAQRLLTEPIELSVFSEQERDRIEHIRQEIAATEDPLKQQQLMSTLPMSVREQLYPEMFINGCYISVRDQFAVRTLMQGGVPSDSQAMRQLSAAMPSSVQNALYSEITLKDGAVVSVEDQQKLLMVLQNGGADNAGELRSRLQELPESVASRLDKGVDMNRVTQIAVFLIILYVLSYLLSASQGLIMAEVTQRVSRRMRGDISRKINRLPMLYYSRTSTGDVLSRVTNDVDTIGQSLNQSIGQLLTAAVLLAGSLFMMFKTNWILSLTAIGASLLGFFFMFAVMSKSQKYFARQQQHLGEINGHVEEIYTGHTVVKAYNGEEKSQHAFDRMNQALRDSSFRAQCLSGLMMPMMNFIGNFGYVAVCIVGGMLALDGKIGFGVIVAFMLYVRYFTQPLSQIGQAMQSLQSAAAAGERVFEFLDAEEMENESQKPALPESPQGAVEFSHVRFGYEGTDKAVIHDFSLHVRPGQKIAIVGPTGAGKTTLVNLLMRFYEIQGGSIRIDGVPTDAVTRESVHSRFCMVLQDTWLFEGTLRENLVYCTENVSDEALKKACKAVGLYHFIKTLPDGFDTYLNDKVSLSQGQKQQLTIARAMLANKPMLILDEATSSVDTRTELKIQQAMDKLMENRTSFVIAHRLSTIRNADLILVLKDGDVIESGTHGELMEQDGFYADLYNSQFVRPADAFK